MKLTERDKKLLYFLAIFVIIMCAFFFGYQKLTDATLEYEDEYTSLNARYTDLSIKAKKLEKYKADTEKYKMLYDVVLDKYAAGNTQEYLIMFLRNAEESTGIWFSQTGFSEASRVYTMGEYTSTNPSNTSYKLQTDLTAYRAVITLTYEATYDELKKFIAFIENYKEKYSIDSISCAYKSEEKLINGTIQLVQYAVVGNREFKNVMIPAVTTGTENIFSSSIFAGGDTTLEDTDGARIVYDYDLYMILSPCTSDVDSVILGIKNDDNSIVSVNSNKTEEVTIKVTGEKGSYRVMYTVGDKKYPEANYDLGSEFTPGDTLDMLIISSKRKDVKDLSGVKVTLINETDMKLNTKIVNDDDYSPRYILASKEGEVSTY